jgi:hypothetical protein
VLVDLAVSQAVFTGTGRKPMTKTLSVVLNLLLFIAVIGIADRAGNWAETLASPGNEWI